MSENKKEMIPKLISGTWRKYPTETSKQKATYGLFECQYCKKEFETSIQSVKCGDTKSCGCISKETSTTHGLCHHRFYHTWYSMTYRCNNPKDKGYKDYGGRGITVCEGWLDVANFVAWAESTHPNVKGVSLDRIDNDKGYSPENCRWADASTQALNQRVMNSNKSGYVGIYYYKKYNTWGANIRINKILKQIGTFKTKEEAVLARDQYIIDNGLPHKLQVFRCKAGQTVQKGFVLGVSENVLDMRWVR